MPCRSQLEFQWAPGISLNLIWVWNALWHTGRNIGTPVNSKGFKRIQKVHNGSYWHTIPERLCYQLQLVSLDLQTRDNAWAVQQLSWFTWTTPWAAPRIQYHQYRRPAESELPNTLAQRSVWMPCSHLQSLFTDAHSPMLNICEFSTSLADPSGLEYVGHWQPGGTHGIRQLIYFLRLAKCIKMLRCGSGYGLGIHGV